ncbi:uncharacterized protein VDAG_06596 [Verticillium dahliae VdLs.17]|uniref:RRM domain-containing protein n=1 Tax=Verticillium dahliae (strain VdLs.17 / ATCC MYA-4575 / FGSC 10137) TaxID=498257 RepID=G2X8W4_VERDV|nr:uncharacterized protein VDAG_06596 [Verticillium dahliae VdLs.17]EGY15432.1 hypothetical protein VDAG_06596 [Verticillium dahliae VdLs.17]
MALTHDVNGFDPSSPHSSCGGAESFKGTPDTRLTSFSPDEKPAKTSCITELTGKPWAGTKPSQFPVGIVGKTPSIGDKDPFVTVYSRARTTSLLSPTASAFHPFSAQSELSEGLTNSMSTSRGSNASNLASHESSIPQFVQIMSPGHALRLGDIISYLEVSTSSATVVHDNIHRARLVCEALRIAGDQWLRHTAVTSPTLQVSILAFSPVPGALDVVHTQGIILQLLQSRGEVVGYQSPQRSSGLIVYAAFAEYASPADAYSAVAAYNGCLFEDIIVHLSILQGHDTPPSSAMHDSTSVLSPVVERNLDQSMQELTLGKHTPASQLVPSPTVPPIGPSQQYPPTRLQVQQPYTMWPIICHAPFQSNMAAYRLDNGHQNAIPSSPASVNYQFMATLATGTSNAQVVPIPDDFCQPRTMPAYPRPDIRRQHASRVNRMSLYGVASHHNHVDVGRIREGTDVRTTIMLRNIPNKVDQAMLKRIVDDSSWGKYDFMYLRIDFANDCNVGYAFINFVDFVNARGNQRWNCFKSDKVAEISYATIQGKDCLVQKFRNSSVMLEAAHYRPKLFYTSNGPVPELAGQEEPFPQPDNQSKMKRSCENAEHVGLFTPNAGQHFRDEQRRRRSQYDRGTRLAALEEHEFETANESYMHYSR